MKKICIYSLCVCLCVFVKNAYSQSIYTMRDTTITECKGVLTDSDKGDNGLGSYGNNEDFRFTICTSNPITLVFIGQFCLEPSTDSLRFFDGPNTNSPQIGITYTGYNSPPSITANSGCLTIHFKSDASATFCGWKANWSSPIIPPTPPSVSINPAITCNINQATLNFSNGVRCDSIKAKYFSITGPMSSTVTLASPLACANNTTASVDLIFNPALNKNCTYMIKSTTFIIDNCDSIWTFTNTTPLLINACPFTASINAVGSNTICSGFCSTITAIPQSPCLNYNYTWSHGLLNGPGPHMICPISTTIYTVTLTESVSGNSFTTTKTIFVESPKIDPLPINITTNDTICQSVKAFSLTATPPGGVWFGAGITDTIHGIFNPDTATAGTFYIKYKVNNFCTDSIKIVVIAMDAGFDDAGCVSGATFTISGGVPVGGIWSGSPFITANGVFDPSTIGTHTVTYTHPNGCSESKLIHVNTLSVPTLVDTMCQSVWYDTLKYVVSPFGGRFSGAGITDSIYGVFNPTIAGGGLNTITYKLGNGCISTFKIFVKNIYAQRFITACPTQPSFTLPTATPLGGIWSGVGIINSTTGLYDPSIITYSNRVDTFLYKAPNGCVDTLFSWCVKTTLVKDTLFFCSEDDSLKLVYDPAYYYPEFGVFSGPGIVLHGSDYYFNPATAGVGIHTVTYVNNTCSDNMKMIVYPSKIPIHDSTICSTHPPYIIAQMPPRTVWHGPGVNSTTGLFNPATAGTGTFNIYYTTPAGCSDTSKIIVYPYQAADISGVASSYCYKDTIIYFSLNPSGGIVSGLATATNTFNPKNLGAGNYMIKYTYGQGICYTADSVKFNISPPLQTVVTNTEDSICNGGGSIITVLTSGGPAGSSYQYQWSNGLFPNNSNIVIPTSSTIYTIKTSDGCSDPKIDSVAITVNPSFATTFVTSSIKCYGETGSASITITPSGSYSYIWSTSPVQTTSSLTNAVAGKSYYVTIKNINTGCTLDTFIKIPSYPPIKALFSPNPNLACVPFEESLVTFIDLSNGADNGYWDFNGKIIPYVPGQSPQFQFENSGNFDIKLTVNNAGNCIDLYSMQICINESTELFVPDIFSPNGDGQNDIFYVRGKGIKELHFLIFDRWGEKIFDSTDKDKGWDGTYKGKDLDPAVYVYYIEALMGTDKKIIKKGDITLMK